jgi:hypothetical protein
MTLSVQFNYKYFVETFGVDGSVVLTTFRTTTLFTITESNLPTGTGETAVENLFEVGETVIGTPSSGGAYIGQNDQGIFVDYATGTWFFSNNPNLAGETLPINFISATCFLQGAHVACEHGDVAAEDLNIGDRVRLADGSLAPIRWVGRQTHFSLFADPLSALPVRIAAGALAEGVPGIDLYLSPDHAVLVGDVLIHAGALVNGTTITRMTRRELPERFTYFHIELEAHAVVLAEGAPCESFVPNVTRARFENFADYLAMFGEEQAIEEMAYPRAKSPRQVPPETRVALAKVAERRELAGAVAA